MKSRFSAEFCVTAVSHGDYYAKETYYAFRKENVKNKQKKSDNFYRCSSVIALRYNDWRACCKIS